MATGFSAGFAVEVQQFRLRYPRHSHTQSDRTVLWRRAARADLSAARHDVYANHQRSEHHSESRRWLPAVEWRNKKSGMGFANAQHHCGRRALHQRSGYGEMGRRALHGKVAEAGKSESNVDAGPFE